MSPQGQLTRTSYLENKIIFVDGFVGGGKTLFCQLVSSLDKVEMWVHRPLVEQVSGLYAHKNIDLNTAVSLLNCCFDNEIYCQALLRDQNFRHFDHSSVFKFPKKARWSKRRGNESRNGMMCNDINGEMVPHFILERIDEYANANEYERAIIMLEEWIEEGNKVVENKKYQIIEVPFEMLVFNPKKYIQKVSSRLDIELSDNVLREMRRQKVPRKSLDDAPKSSIFQAYGWRQPEKHISAKDQIKDELNEMRGYLKSNMMKRVERLVENYVSRYLDFKL